MELHDVTVTKELHFQVQGSSMASLGRFSVRAIKAEEIMMVIVGEHVL
jgi:hypothetical protein